MKLLKLFCLLTILASASNCKRNAIFNVDIKNCDKTTKSLDNSKIIKKLEGLIYKNESVQSDEKTKIEFFPIDLKPFNSTNVEIHFLTYDSTCSKGKFIVFPTGNVDYYLNIVDEEDLYRKTQLRKGDFIKPLSSSGFVNRLNEILNMPASPEL